MSILFPVHRSGWLWKVGGSVQSWKKRWMVIQGKNLFYYKHEADQTNGTSPQGTIPLDGASVAPLLANNEFSSSTGEHNSGLFGITPTGSTRMYVIQACDTADRDAWIQACTLGGAFRINLTPLSSKTQADSLLEGWIDKQQTARFGLFGGSSERVYAVLFDNRIAIWKNVQTSSQPIDQIMLSNDSVLIVGKSNAPFEIVGKKGESKWILQADDELQKHDWASAIGAVIKGQPYQYPGYQNVRGSTAVSPHGHSRPTIPASPSSSTSSGSVTLPTPLSSISEKAPQSTSNQVSTKLKHNIAIVGDSDDDSDDEPPPPPPMDANHMGADEDDSDREDDMSKLGHGAVDVAEDVDFESLPPPPPIDELEVPTPPSTMMSPNSVQLHDQSVLHSQPDVLLQLGALLSSRFNGDAIAMQAYLDSFSKQVLSAPQPPPPDVEEIVVDAPGTRRMTTKLSRMLVHGSSLNLHNAPPPRKMLHVHLLEARDLPAMDSNGFSDPYCVLHIAAGGDHKKDTPPGGSGGSGTRVKSKTIAATLDPVFDQQMTLDLEPYDEELVVDVFDFDKFSTDDFIGRAVIPIKSLKSHHSGLSGWYPLGGIKDSWATVGSIFIGCVLDEHLVDAASRNGNVAFTTARAQCLLAQEARYFAAQGIPPSITPSPPVTSLVPSASSSFASLFHDETIKVFCATWNVGNANGPDDLTPLLPLYIADIYVIGTQECEYAPRRDHKSCKHDWQSCLIRHFGRDYTMVKYHSLWQIRCAVFVHNRHLPHITNVHAYHEATGIGNVLGNKGAALVALQYKSLKMCFVSSHLAAHQNTCDLRNQNYRTICRNVHVGPMGQSDILNEYHHLVWMGDLNYRLDYGNQGDAKSPSQQLFDEMTAKVKTGKTSELEDLFKVDQLAREMKHQRSFIGFKEGVYNFPPTFKVKRLETLEYTSQRSPAWCDRILWRSVAGFDLQQLSLSAVTSIGTSDHKPVVSMLEMSVPAIPPPLDRTLGDAVLRIHDLRCRDLRAPRENNKDQDSKDWAKDLDPQLVFLASCLAKPIITPVVKKASSPQWLELPSSPATYNSLARIKQTLVYVRVLNHQSQDAIVGRGIISLKDLAPVADDGAHETHSASQGIDAKGRAHTQRFEVEVTYGGMPAGYITGQLTVLFKAKATRK